MELRKRLRLPFKWKIWLLIIVGREHDAKIPLHLSQLSSNIRNKQGPFYPPYRVHNAVLAILNISVDHLIPTCRPQLWLGKNKSCGYEKLIYSE